MTPLPENAVCTASPSLALTKYWGKAAGGPNIPATSSLAVTLRDLSTITRVQRSTGEDTVIVDGAPQEPLRFTPLFDAMRAEAGVSERFLVESTNSFPTAAGLASSSSGVAALVCALDALLGTALPGWKLSRIARAGSGSGARAVYGGFTVLPARGTEAEQLYPASHWSELRVVVAVLERGRKAMSSREAMERTRRSSPYFGPWMDDAEEVTREAREALARRDIERLGHAMRLSYLRMFATMFAADPPVVYWQPASLTALRTCESLRRDGVPAFETMDAGPQVKVLTTEDHVGTVRDALEEGADHVLLTGIGDGPRVETDIDLEAPVEEEPT